MEMKLGYVNTPVREKTPFWPAYLCFAVLGLLIPFSKSDVQAVALLLSVLLALAVGLLFVKLLIILLNSGNPALRAETAGRFAPETVSAGLLFMIPFTVLAGLAQVFLNWAAVMPFASAAIMTAAATAGTEVMEKGARGIKNVLIPSGLAFVFSTGWMLLVGLLP